MHPPPYRQRGTRFRVARKHAAVASPAIDPLATDGIIRLCGSVTRVREIAVKRHASMEDLSRDHYQALIQVQEIRKSVEGQEGARPLEQVATEFLEFWEKDAIAHFREEEEILLPIYARHVQPSHDEHVRRMLDDHAWFRDVMFELKRRVGERGNYGALLGEVGERLSDHARLEEREIFERMQAVMTEEDFADVAERSLAFRREWRNADAIGRPRLGSTT
jgi:hemerythrin-like domain-containing protein